MTWAVEVSSDYKSVTHRTISCDRLTFICLPLDRSASKSMHEPVICYCIFYTHARTPTSLSTVTSFIACFDLL